MTKVNDDVELLGAYIEQHSEKAFAEVVGRYSSMVFQTALRRTRNSTTAEDVTQAVFIVLSRRAGDLHREASLAAWLHKTTLYACANALRAESRRQKRERAAARSEVAAQSLEHQILHTVDQAISKLRRKDREIICLRYLEERPIKEIAAKLEISEQAAGKRLTRALDQLRSRLGITTAAVTAFLVAMGAGSSHASAQAFASAAIAGGVEGSAFHLAEKTMWMFRRIAILKFAAVGIVLMGISVTAVAHFASKPWEDTTVVVSLAKPADVTIDQIITAVERNEHALQNLHVKKFEGKFQRLKPGATQWIDEPDLYAGSLWLDLKNRRERLYVSRWVAPWISGKGGLDEKPSAYIETSDDYSFDGKEGREARVSSSGKVFTMEGAPIQHKTTADQFGVISSSRPMMMDVRFFDYAAGTDLFLPLKKFRNESISATMKRGIKLEKPSIRRETINGFDCIRVMWGDGTTRWDAWWFDPSKNYALIKFEEVATFPDGKLVLQQRDEVTELKEAAPRIWLATAGKHEERDVAQQDNLIRINYHAEDVIGNDPKLDENIFTITFPVGYIVRDDRKNSEYIVEQATTLPIHRGSIIPAIHLQPYVPPEE